MSRFDMSTLDHCDPANTLRERSHRGLRAADRPEQRTNKCDSHNERQTHGVHSLVPNSFILQSV